MGRNDSAIPIYFTPGARARLASLRTEADSTYWHDKEVEFLIQMAVRYGFKYDLEQSLAPGQQK